MIASLVVLLASASAARAADEIQIYNAQIAAVGQWTFQQHLNYTFNGRKEPDFPGGLVPNHALNGTPEFAYGMTDWWEVGFYIPFAVSGSGVFLSNGAKIRSLFAVPHAGERNFFLRHQLRTQLRDAAILTDPFCIRNPADRRRAQ